MPELTMKEIYKQSEQLRNQQVADWDKIWESIGHKDGNKSKDATYAKLSFHKILEVLTSIDNFVDGVPPFIDRSKFGELFNAARRIEEYKLSPEDKKLLKLIEYDYDNALRTFSEANKEAVAIIETLDTKVKEVVSSDYPRSLIPKNIPFAASLSIFHEISQAAAQGKTSKLDTFADTILFMYAQTAKKAKPMLAKHIQDHLKFPGLPKKFLKALDAKMKELFADERQSKMFSDEDKEVLKGLFEHKSLFARIFRKKSAELEQKMIIDQALAQGKDKTL